MDGSFLATDLVAEGIGISLSYEVHQGFFYRFPRLGVLIRLSSSRMRSAHVPQVVVE